MDTDRDDSRRAKKRVVVCLRDLGDVTSRLIFDDVAAESEANPAAWRFETFYTWNAVPTSCKEAGA